MAKRSKNYAEGPTASLFWHYGGVGDFSDHEQEEDWIATVNFLETGLDPDKGEGHPAAMAVVTFLQHQTSPIKPGLAKIIGRLMAGEPFPRDDRWLLRLAPPAFARGRGMRQTAVEPKRSGALER